MRAEFSRVDAALASSLAGRAIGFLNDALGAAWDRSSSGALARALGRAWRHTPAPASIRAVAVAIAIAAGLQPVLISVMPATVVPAIPRPAFIVIAIFAALAAWQAEMIARAWPDSIFARGIRR